MTILLFGPPGCGKGTQSAFIARRLNIPAISTGDMLRAGLAAGTQNGETRLLVNSGNLVGDTLVNAMVTQRISQPDCREGFLLDGYPRTIPQAHYLRDQLRTRGLPESTVIHLDVPGSVLIERVTARRQCPECGRIYNLLFQAPRVANRCDVEGATLERRGDDDENVVASRLGAYERITGPLIEFYKGPDYYRVDGNRPPHEITSEIESILDQCLMRVRSA
ncbi:MAG: nucleoside monophosphate kinase [Bryobacteraceae bacterium]